MVLSSKIFAVLGSTHKQVNGIFAEFWISGRDIIIIARHFPLRWGKSLLLVSMVLQLRVIEERVSGYRSFRC